VTARERLAADERGRRWVAGIDGCTSGWVVALLDVDRGACRALVVRRFAEVLALPERPRRVAVDMPVGLLDVARRGGRTADRAARAALGARAATIFSAPSRIALEASLRGEPYAEVCRAERARSPEGVGLSKQAFFLLPKIGEIDALGPRLVERHVHEAHPELAFARMNGGTPLADPKKTPTGRRRRLALLRGAGLDAKVISARLLGARPDDVLDAWSLAVTARRLLEGHAVALPTSVELDRAGLRMAVWW
jgi:predicted RNase H-like nuclease